MLSFLKRPVRIERTDAEIVESAMAEFHAEYDISLMGTPEFYALAKPGLSIEQYTEDCSNFLRRKP